MIGFMEAQAAFVDVSQRPRGQHGTVSTISNKRWKVTAHMTIRIDILMCADQISEISIRFI